MILLYLFCEFFQIGLFAVGGGMAALPYVYKLTEKYTWFDFSEVSKFIAISEASPGPLAVNMATYAGYKASGVPGGLTATIAVVLPSIIIASVIAGFLGRFKENKHVKSAFYGIRPAVCALIACAAVQVAKECLITWDKFTQSWSFANIADWKMLALFAVLFGLSQIKQLKKVHPAAYIGAAAVVGVVFKM